jgi:GNAT superfamily N-acetyltransferase
MLNINELAFRKLDFPGLQKLVNWAKNEGWNPGPNDADVFWKADPDGYYGFFYNEELIAGGSIVSYNGDFGFMGFFIVQPEYRSVGIGRKLWYQRRDKLLSRMKKGSTIGMDGVVAMQGFYTKGGFKIAFRDERHEKIGSRFKYSSKILPITAADYENVFTYDKLYFGYSRTEFLIPWLTLPGSKSFKYEEEGSIKGMAIIRVVSRGYKICPLFAENAQIAEELYKACLNAAIGDPVYLDIPVINKAAVDLTRKYGATYVFECARMYHGEPPKINMNNIYGITTFELG